MAPSSYFWMIRRLLPALLALICCATSSGQPQQQQDDDNAPLTPIPETKRIPGTEINQPIEAASRSVKPQPPLFIIGVWSQPGSSFAVWKARGVNTAVNYESQGGSVSMDQWCASAEFNQLWMIRQPRPNPHEDRDEPYLLAWMQSDEPDVHDTPPNDLTGLYQRLKAADSTRPIFLNVSGGNVLFNKTPHGTYQQYFAAADWIGNDFYPVTGWNQPSWLPRVGEAVDMCRQLSRGKPQFAFIETSQQRLSWTPANTPGVTPAQLRAEIWDAIIHGAKGIVYFPDQFNPFKYDGTPTAVSIEMAKNDMLLAQLAPALSNAQNTAGMSASVNAPLEAAWRTAPNGTIYLIVLNLSRDHQSGVSIVLTGFPISAATVLNQDKRSLSIAKNGLIDDFAGYDMHIYAIPPAVSAPPSLK